jgi:DNA-binding CsgD family transcriptional regulator
MLPSFEILQTVAKAYSISVDDITGRRRSKDIAEARQLTAYFLRRVNNLSYPAIGRILGGKDHTTAIYSVNKISQEIEARPKFKVFVEGIIDPSQVAETVLSLNKPEPLTSDEIKYLSQSLSGVAQKGKAHYGFITSEDILRTNRNTEVTEREADILLKYRRGMTLEEIAVTTNVTRERVRQIVMSTLIKELGQKAKNGFKIDVQEYIDSQKDLHNKSRYLSEDQRNEILKRIEAGASLKEILETAHISEEKFFEIFPQYKEKFELEPTEKKRWSWYYLKCKNCGTTAIPHRSNGLCEKCYPKSDRFKELTRASNERNHHKRNEHYRGYLKEYSKRPDVMAKSRKAWDLKHYGGNREKAIEMSGFKCVKCGISREDAIKTFGKELFVRHIDRDENNNSLSNLEVLCHSCFQKARNTVRNRK